MPLPQFVLRSYGGGADVAQLVNAIGSTDTSFTIAPDTGWVEEDGSPLGTVGPFTVVIDRFTPQIEKILCSAINLSTGQVTVYVAEDGASGRGYDGTAGQAHVPGGSTSGVQTCWTSVEASEANQAVYDVLGGGSEGLIGVPIGSLVPFGGNARTLPANFLGAQGQAVSRTTYADCLAALTITGTGTTTNAGATITSVSSAVTPLVTAGMQMTLINSGGAVYTVASTTSTTIVLTSGTGITAGTAGDFIVYPHGAGDGTTTFNLPDSRGRALVGVGLVNTTSQPNTYVGRYGGSTQATLTSTTQLPSHDHSPITITDGGHNHGVSGTEFVVGISSGQNNSINITGGGTSGSAGVTFSADTDSDTTGITAAATGEGASAPFSVVNPVYGITYIIRVT